MLMTDYYADFDSHSMNKRGHERLPLSTFVWYESRLLSGIPGNKEYVLYRFMTLWKVEQKWEFT